MDTGNGGDLFDVTTRCYTAGVQRQIPVAPVPGFNKNDALLARLPEEDANRIRGISGFRARVLTAAREGNFHRAHGLLKLAVRQLSLKTMSEEGSFVALQIVKPLESYICYKQSDYERASTLMKKAIWCANALRDTFDCPDMDPRRVHFAGNLMRLVSESGKTMDAAEMGIKLLHYVEGDGSMWPLDRLKAQTSDVRISDVLQFPMFSQIATKLVFQLAYANETDRARALQAGERLTRQRDAGDTHRVRSLMLWLQAKRAWANGDTTTFLMRASTFFASCQEAHALQIALAVDVCHFCQLDGSASALELEQTIVEHLGTSKKFENLMGIISSE